MTVFSLNVFPLTLWKGNRIYTLFLLKLFPSASNTTVFSLFSFWRLCFDGSFIVSRSCVSFCCVAWISDMYTHSPSLWRPPPAPRGPHRAPCRAPLYGTVPRAARLHVVVYTRQTSSPGLSRPSPNHGVHKSLLKGCLSVPAPANRLICTIFLDSIHVHYYMIFLNCWLVISYLIWWLIFLFAALVLGCFTPTHLSLSSSIQLGFSIFSHHPWVHSSQIPKFSLSFATRFGLCFHLSGV